MVLTISGVVRVCADRAILGLASLTQVFHKKYDILHSDFLYYGCILKYSNS